MEQTNQLISTAEAAKFLGIKVSYLHKLMMRRVIPYYKPNGKLCFFDPLLQTKRQTVLLRQGRPGGVDEERPRGIAGGTRPAGTKVHHQPS